MIMGRSVIIRNCLLKSLGSRSASTASCRNADKGNSQWEFARQIKGWISISHLFKIQTDQSKPGQQPHGTRCCLACD